MKNEDKNIVNESSLHSLIRRASIILKDGVSCNNQGDAEIVLSRLRPMQDAYNCEPETNEVTRDLVDSLEDALAWQNRQSDIGRNPCSGCSSLCWGC